MNDNRIDSDVFQLEPLPGRVRIASGQGHTDDTSSSRIAEDLGSTALEAEFRARRDALHRQTPSHEGRLGAGPVPKVLYRTIIWPFRFVVSLPWMLLNWFYQIIRSRFEGKSQATTLTAGIVTVVLVAAALLTTSPMPQEASPAFQNRPQAIPAMPQFIPQPANQWDSHMWLDHNQTLALRHNDNVVNLAYIESAQVRYSAGNTVTFDAGKAWHPATSPWIESIGVDGTAVTLQLTTGRRLTLNTYMPIVFAEDPNGVLIVDAAGRVWAGVLGSQPDEVQLQDVDRTMPYTVQPNPNLTLRSN